MKASSQDKPRKYRHCRTCGTFYAGWRCPKCKPKRRRSSGGSAGGTGRGGAAARVLSYSSPIGPINPSACPQPEAECRFCGFPVSRCYCSRGARRSVPTETDHDALIDAMLNRADALADLADEFDTLATRQEIFGAAYPESSPLASPYAGALSDVLERVETHLQEATL